VDWIKAAVNVVPQAVHALEVIFTIATPFRLFLSCSYKPKSGAGMVGNAAFRSASSRSI
jgi:hypothetical protein